MDFCGNKKLKVITSKKSEDPKKSSGTLKKLRELFTLIPANILI